MRTRLGLYLILLGASACQTPYDKVPPTDIESGDGFGVLVFTKIAGFRHVSIQAGQRTIETEGRARGWRVYSTENGAVFTPDLLQHFDVVVWLNTTDDVLNTSQESAFQAYVEGGGGYVGIHSAADTEHDWAWYGTLVGARFSNHPNFPNVREAEVVIEASDHPATAFLPKRWTRQDEWYNFAQNPRDIPDIRVLATVDEQTYGGGTMGTDHPIIWSQSVGAGRAFYTALGHPASSFSDSLFVRHITEAIAWAGQADSSTTTPFIDFR